MVRFSFISFGKDRVANTFRLSENCHRLRRHLLRRQKVALRANASVDHQDGRYLGYSRRGFEIAEAGFEQPQLTQRRSQFWHTLSLGGG